MKFSIDPRYSLFQTIIWIGTYLITLFLCLKIFHFSDASGFVGNTLVACGAMFLISLFPRKITLENGILSFKDRNWLETKKVILSDIVNIQTEKKFYNTIKVTTLSGETFRFHPEDMDDLENVILTNHHR